MNDKDIIKALEYCDSNGACEECPFYEECCENRVVLETIDLIKRQQEEIEGLQRRIVFWREDMDYDPKR